MNELMQNRFAPTVPLCPRKPEHYASATLIIDKGLQRRAVESPCRVDGKGTVRTLPVVIDFKDVD